MFHIRALMFFHRSCFSFYDLRSPLFLCSRGKLWHCEMPPRPFPFSVNVKQHQILLTALMLHLQTCMDKHQVVGVLRQMEKFLKGQEMRFTEGLRIMKSKLATLQNSVSKMPQADQSAGKSTLIFYFIFLFHYCNYKVAHCEAAYWTLGKKIGFACSDRKSVV